MEKGITAPYPLGMADFEQMIAEQQLWTSGMRRAWRHAAGLTLDQVAERLGVTKMTVWRWESGERTPRGQHRVEYSRLLRALKDSVDV